MWAFLLDLKRQVTAILQPAHGGTGSTYGEQRVVGKFLNSTGSTIALYTLVEYTFGANDKRIRKVAATNALTVLGVLVGYYGGDGALVEAACPDGYEAAVQTAGECPVLIESAVTRSQYAFSAATDGKIVSSATVAAGAFGLVVTSADTSAGSTTAIVQFPLTTYPGAGSTPAPVGADYLVGTANATLTDEIVVGATPGGELGGTWAAPTVDGTHSGSSHAATQAAAEATASAALAGHTHAPGGSVAVPIYMPDAPPASPHANDDEFTNAAVGAAWTEWDHGTIQTPLEDHRGLVANPTNAGVDKWCGYYRAIPAGDWSIMTKVTLTNVIPDTGDFYDAGLLLLENGASSTADHYGFVLQVTSAAGLRRGVAIREWSAYNALNVSTYAMEADGLTLMSHVYLRIRRISGVYYYDWSTDGEGWTELFNHTPAQTITHVGLGIWKGSAREAAAAFRFWRQIAGTTLQARIQGQVLEL